jgi:hypothetical protein
MQWGSYAFLAGLLIGVLIGWMFAGFVGTIVRFGLIMVAVIPLVLMYVVWRRYIAPWLRPPVERPYNGPVDAIETRAVVQGQAREPIRR